MSIDLTGVVLTYADLRSADLGGANLKDAFLNKALRSQAKGTSEEIQKENVRERFLAEIRETPFRQTAGKPSRRNSEHSSPIHRLMAEYSVCKRVVRKLA